MIALATMSTIRVTIAALPPQCAGFTLSTQGIAEAETALGHQPTNTSAQCCSLCSATEGCHAWTWHPPVGGKSDPMAKICWLMPKPGKPHNTGLVSGVQAGWDPPPPPPAAPMPPLPPATGLTPPLGFQPHIVYVLTDDQGSHAR
jgi:hypothetical protein